jgi:hypothetical protein
MGHGGRVRCVVIVVLPLLLILLEQCHPVHAGAGGAAASTSICPSSPAWVYARCEMTITFEQSCSKVKEEILARSNKSNNKDNNKKQKNKKKKSKVDPQHSDQRGKAATITYHLNETIRTSTSDILVFQVVRQGPSSAMADPSVPTTDKMAFNFIPRIHGDNGVMVGKEQRRRERDTTAGCVVKACSTSQRWSVLDQFTNYCNIHNLYYCNNGGKNNTMTSWPHIQHDLTYTERYDDCWQRKVQRCHT